MGLDTPLRGYSTSRNPTAAAWLRDELPSLLIE